MRGEKAQWEQPAIILGGDSRDAGTVLESRCVGISAIDNSLIGSLNRFGRLDGIVDPDNEGQSAGVAFAPDGAIFEGSAAGDAAEADAIDAAIVDLEDGAAGAALAPWGGRPCGSTWRALRNEGLEFRKGVGLDG